MINHFKAGDRIIRVKRGENMTIGTKCTVSAVQGNGTNWIRIKGGGSIMYIADNFKHLITCKAK